MPKSRACPRGTRKVGTALRAFAHPTVLAFLALSVSLATPCAAQRTPQIWDVRPGTPVGDLPEDDFVDTACGTHGGPPGLRIAGFEEFVKCRAEPSGLREIWFRYDDEAEYIARAARDPDAIARNNAMLMLGQPVVLSLLIDVAGRAQGWRIFTDPRAEADVRADAYTLAFAFKTQFGTDGWDCSDAPPAAGETAMAGTFVKQQCRKIANGQRITVESRHYYKSGQAALDPNTGLATVNQFESAASIETVSVEALK
jgi:hypothetical protein